MWASKPQPGQHSFCDVAELLGLQARCYENGEQETQVHGFNQKSTANYVGTNARTHRRTDRAKTYFLLSLWVDNMDSKA